MPVITIAICTYKRIEIKKTLESLSKQILKDNICIKILVADNDVDPTMRDKIEGFADNLGLDLTYVHAPFRNISIARNACLSNCKTKWLAFIDDDETVSDTWISELYKTAINKKADIVLGPVVSIYADNTPYWIVKNNFHATKAVFVNGVIETGYTCNTLLDLESICIKDMKFDLGLGRSGGEDTDYFSRAFKKGANLQYSPNAIVYEPVTAARATLSWLIKRKFRMGQTYAPTQYSEDSSKIYITKFIIKALSKFTFCFIMALLTCLSPVKRYSWILRGCFHFGVLTKLTGMKNIELY
ncbi:glycosyltransferase family 2 protein [Pseudoalteromonas sp. TAE56]|uniref:glycosyltransferase family 2 protein n=1 Tax=Pseudoalteromonas sp. TAE56 TaxID=1938596 RepID=UPI00041EA52C|nr:glycosyltransferase family 2 protein [Pseudoalteromonas sp. TAE56]